MHKQRLVWLILLLAGGLLLPTAPALADGDPPDNNGIFIWNEDYTLEEGEWLDGDLVVFNGDVTLEVGSHVEGSVIIWNGNAEVEGTVEKDLVVSSGDITLDDSARVKGNVVCSWNCDINQKEGARVDGGIIEGAPLRGLRLENGRGFPVPVPSLPTSWVSGPGRVLKWVLGVIRGVVAILVVAAVAGLVALIWPRPMALVGRVVTEAPWPSFGIGLLTVAAATALIIALTVTICLSPVAALAALALGAAGLFGWIGIGAVVGERLLQALNVHSAPLWAAGLGTLLVTLIGAGLSAAFCLAPLGWLLIFGLGCLGLGAVVLTRFGTTAYTPSTGSEHHPPRPTQPPTPAPVKASAYPGAPEEEAEQEPPTPPVPTPVQATEPTEPPEEEAASDEPPEGESAE